MDTDASMSSSIDKAMSSIFTGIIIGLGFWPVHILYNEYALIVSLLFATMYLTDRFPWGLVVCFCVFF